MNRIAELQTQESNMTVENNSIQKMQVEIGRNVVIETINQLTTYQKKKTKDREKYRKSE